MEITDWKAGRPPRELSASPCLSGALTMNRVRQSKYLLNIFTEFYADYALKFCDVQLYVSYSVDDIQVDDILVNDILVNDIPVHNMHHLANVSKRTVCNSISLMLLKLKNLRLLATSCGASTLPYS